MCELLDGQINQYTYKNTLETRLIPSIRQLYGRIEQFIFQQDGAPAHTAKSIKEYFDNGQEMFNLCQQILEENGFYFGQSDYVRRISVWVGNLQDAINLEQSLFDFDVKSKKIVQTVDMLNEKFGDHTIRRGFLLNADKLTTVPNGFMADRYEKQKLAAEFNPKLT